MIAFKSNFQPLYGQDSIWLQSTKAWSRIERSITEQKSDMLFFNGAYDFDDRFGPTRRLKTVKLPR